MKTSIGICFPREHYDVRCLFAFEKCGSYLFMVSFFTFCVSSSQAKKGSIFWHIF